jgi:hypothetical protein
MLVEVVPDQGLVDRLEWEPVEVGPTTLAQARNLACFARDGEVGLGETPAFIGDKCHGDVLFVARDRYLTGLERLCGTQRNLGHLRRLRLGRRTIPRRCQVVGGIGQHHGGTRDPGDGVDDIEAAGHAVVAVEHSVVGEGQVTPAAAKLD